MSMLAGAIDASDTVPLPTVPNVISAHSDAAVAISRSMLENMFHEDYRNVRV